MLEKRDPSDILNISSTDTRDLENLLAKSVPTNQVDLSNSKKMESKDTD